MKRARIFPLYGLLVVGAMFIYSASQPDMDLCARKIKTSLRSGKSKKKNSKETQKSDLPKKESSASSIFELCNDSTEINLLKRNITFSGYDKSASSAYESLCITNSSDRAISEIILDITYTDLSGRMIHRREVTQSIEIPPGETRTISFRHYDRQKTLYFKRSTPPRKGGMPYDIKIRLKDIK